MECGCRRTSRSSAAATPTWDNMSTRPDHRAMPFAEMGEMAAQNLLALLAGASPPSAMVLPHRLIIRHSVAARR